METFSITINPSPFKKWDWPQVFDLMKTYNEVYVCKKFKNYDSMDIEIQIDLLNSIVKYIMVNLVETEWSQGYIEYTRKGNAHIHTHFRSPIKNHDFVIEVITKVAEKVNKFFSSGLQFKALHYEETVVDIIYWIKYEQKEVWKSISRNDFPDSER